MLFVKNEDLTPFCSYEMNKLRACGVVEKKKGMSFYRVTGTGWKWLWISYLQRCQGLEVP